MVMERERRKSYKPLYTRREFLAASILGGGAIIGGAYLAMSKSKETQSRTTEETIQREIQRLGIKPSKNEVELWRRYGFSRPRTPLTENNAGLNEAAGRLENVVRVMSNSENPHFREAINILGPLLISGEAELGLRHGAPDIKVMQAKADIKQDRLIWVIEVPLETINRLDSIQIAISLAHEVEHLRNMISYDNAMRNLPAQSRLLAQAQRAQDLDNFIREEMRAYARQAQAYIYQAGLMGVRDRGSSDEELAVAWIRSGKQVDSATWREYLTQARLQAGIQARQKQNK